MRIVDDESELSLATQSAVIGSGFCVVGNPAKKIPLVERAFPRQYFFRPQVVSPVYP